jgi:hypothetical protein
MTERFHQARALTAVAQVLADAGLPEQAQATAREAEAIAHTLIDPSRKASVLTTVMQAQSSAGLEEQAQATAHEAVAAARGIFDFPGQARALTAVAQAMVSAGLYQQAQATAWAITVPAQRADALAAVAQALADAGHLSEGRKATAVCCASGPWEAAIGPAILLEPSVFVALAPRLAHAWHIPIPTCSTLAD